MNEIMPMHLKIFLVICIVGFLLYVIKNVKDKKLNIKHALIWIVMSVTVIICIFAIEGLASVADLIGVKTVSNLIFFFGFIFLIFATFSLTRTVSAQNQKITKLTQELALLKKKMENENKK